VTLLAAIPARLPCCQGAHVVHAKQAEPTIGLTVCCSACKHVWKLDTYPLEDGEFRLHWQRMHPPRRNPATAH
jgi:hypothetical protein